MWQRIAFLSSGIFVFGPGSGLYIGAGLGPGPRDGLMTGIARRGRSVRVVRTGIELTALAVGAALGGSVGIGTVLFALTVGPNVHWFLDRMTLPEARRADRWPTTSHPATSKPSRRTRRRSAGEECGGLRLCRSPPPAKGRLRRLLSGKQ